MNLVKIAQGWYQFKQGDATVRKRMFERLRICDTCPDKVQTTGAGEVVSAVLGNAPENTFSCGLCSCPLGALASVANPQCKAKKWNHIF